MTTIPNIPTSQPSTKGAKAAGHPGASGDLVAQMGDLFSAFLALLGNGAREMQTGDGKGNEKGEAANTQFAITVNGETHVINLASIDDNTKALLEAFIKEQQATAATPSEPQLANQVKIVLPPALQKFIEDSPLLDRQPQLKLFVDQQEHASDENVKLEVNAISLVKSDSKTDQTAATTANSTKVDAVAKAPINIAAPNIENGSENSKNSQQNGDNSRDSKKSVVTATSALTVTDEPTVDNHSVSSVDAIATVQAPKTTSVETIVVPATNNGLDTPVAQQVSMVVSTLKGGMDGEHRIVLQLTPDNLGTVHIRVDMHGGELDIHMRADNPATESILRGSMHELRTEIESTGLRAGSFDVQTGDAQQFAKQFAHSQRSDTPVLTEDEVLQELHQLAQQLNPTSDLDIRL